MNTILRTTLYDMPEISYFKKIVRHGNLPLEERNQYVEYLTRWASNKYSPENAMKTLQYACYKLNRYNEKLDCEKEAPDYAAKAHRAYAKINALLPFMAERLHTEHLLVIDPLIRPSREIFNENRISRVYLSSLTSDRPQMIIETNKCLAIDLKDRTIMELAVVPINETIKAIYTGRASAKSFLAQSL